MVYWLLSSFVSAMLQVMLDNLAELGKKAYESVADVDYKLEMLTRTLVSVQSVIHDADDKQLSGMEWQRLLQDLEKVAYQADDLIDDITIKVLKLEGGMFPIPKYQTSAPNMNDIQAKLDRMSSEIDSLCLRKLAQETKIVGSLLHSKVDEIEWKNVQDSRIWDLPVMKNEIALALRSCLPLHMRQCFAYCSMFPQGYGFEKNKLIKMWMGEGFITPDKERKLIEDIESSYFDQLLWKSFFHEKGGKYMIHNAIHHLAQSVCGERFLRVEDNDDSFIDTNMRHLSLVCEKIQTKTFEASSKCKGLRTFLLSSAYKNPIKEVHLTLFVKLRSLRVLDLSGTRIEELTKSVGNLNHLRFLDLSNTLLKWLPETMQELCLLQTLRLRNCLKLLSLPKGTWKLRSLRHLELDGVCQLTTMPSGLGKLTGLQTINEFTVGPESGQMKELKDMNNIRGSLRIKQLENVNSPQEALEASLANKKYVEKLEFLWTSTSDARTDEHVLDKLMTCPHASLKELTFSSYGGRMFPNWVSNPLFSKLQNICFYECNNCGLMPPLGQLPKPKFLKIVGMHELVNIEIFLGNSFQSLETLELRDTPKLESWVGVNDNNMVFRELTIVNSPQLVTLPSLHYLRSLKKLEFDNCPQLQSFSDERLSESVEYLIITECVMLEERYKGDGGQDWMKIEHISHIEIDFQVL
ncbi:hypothetical protein AQUCO_00600456v1 [Aquilegia coerulea]|uniref:Uncharacterized protein n=1 Tax=Aquilegia coerulea TaxID=218851 RepID=A0A2G5EPR1_AQUCA|nr:hypothetical protein AQUCO_00600456v1 [Aquilegia coerulea]